MKTLGEKIKRLRNKLTQEELAAILGVDRSTLASWEVNRREPDIATLRRIADFFGVSIDWLVGHAAGKRTVPASGVQETAGIYQPANDPAWQKVILTAEAYGYDPEAVCQLMELNAKIAASLKSSK